MDLKAYYSRIRDVEQAIETECVVLKSIATEAGGVGGRLTEVGRATAARMIVDGTAELATDEESKRHKRDAASRQQAEQERRRAAQVQFTVISESDLRSFARKGRSQKDNHASTT